MVFWYRQSAHPLEPNQFFKAPLGFFFRREMVTLDNPAPGPGEVRVVLDADGRLVDLGAGPRVELTQQARDPDDLLLELAGLNPADCIVAPGEDLARPLLPMTRQRAWRKDGAPSGEAVLARAGWLGDRLVMFRNENSSWVQRENASMTEDPLQGGGHLIPITLFVAGVFLAWHNLRRRSVDLGLLGRLVAVVGLASIVRWALQAHHSPGPGELVLLAIGIGWAGYQIIMCGLSFTRAWSRSSGVSGRRA